MASKFTITAELNLQTKNLNQVVNNLRQQFQGADLNIKVKDLTKVESQLRSVSRSATDASKDFNEAGNAFNQAFKRFTVITAVTGTLVGFTRSVKKAVGDAIEFEREVVKISQATGKTVTQLQGLVSEVGNVATSFGSSSKELLNAARTLTQAGFAADRVTGALKILAQTDLAATFDSIQDTTEGAIALLNQFGRAAQKTGQEAKFLEQSFSAINQVSKEFAVESSDLITAIRTTGSAFESAGGNLNELIALFTSVRSTTRESAESIATGFRTIFTRVQRVDTINALRNLGIELQDVEGKFVGPMEATKRLSAALSSIDPRDFRFNLIVEELGGFRQVSKVIPLIQQFTVAQKALGVAQGASGTLAKDAQTAQQSLAVQIAKTREEFSRFIRELVGSSSFQDTAQFLLGLANAFIKVADSIKPLIPLIAGFAAIKIGNALGVGLKSFASKGASQRAVPIGFATGGLVPGSGNGDTVPAMLTPGEFVIRKSSVNKLGAANLARVNKYAVGGIVEQYSKDVSPFSLTDTAKKGSAKETLQERQKAETTKTRKLRKKEEYGAAFLRPVGADSSYTGYVTKNEVIEKGKIKKSQWPYLTQKEYPFKIELASVNKETKDMFESGIIGGLANIVNQTSNNILGSVAGKQPLSVSYDILKKSNLDQTAGNIFEAILKTISGKFTNNDTVGSGNQTFDFPDGLGDAAKYFDPILATKKTDAKATYNLKSLQSLVDKVKADIKENALRSVPKVEEEIGKAKSPATQISDQTKIELRAKTDQENAILGSLKELALEKFRKEPALKIPGFTTVGLTKKNKLNPQFTAALNARIREKNINVNDLSTVDERKKFIEEMFSGYALGGFIEKFTNGGFSSGTDTVPAMLTPGEFIINKKSAQKIGYASLNRMNKVGKYATGGVVQGFSNGSSGIGVSGGIKLPDTATDTAHLGWTPTPMSTLTDDEDFKIFQKLGHTKEEFDAIVKYISAGASWAAINQFTYPEMMRTAPVSSLDKKRIAAMDAAVGRNKYKVPSRLYSGISGLNLRYLSQAIFGDKEQFTYSSRDIMKSDNMDAYSYFNSGQASKDLVDKIVQNAPGKTYSTNAFMSTALDKGVASGYVGVPMKGNKKELFEGLEYILPGVLAEIIPSGEEITGLGSRKDYSQFVFPRGSKFKILKAFADNKGLVNLVMQHIEENIKPPELPTQYEGSKTRDYSKKVNELTMPFGKFSGMPISKIEDGYLKWASENISVGGKFTKAHKEALHQELLKRTQYKADGGSIFESKGTDTVPAMLTPGEFVVNKKSAEKIGYASLNKMNKVGKYASGGPVQYFANGTSGTGAQNTVFSVSSSGVATITTNEKLKQLRDEQDALANKTADLSDKFLILGSVASSVISQLGLFDQKTADVVSSLTGTFATIKGIGGQLTSAAASFKKVGKDGEITQRISPKLIKGFDIAVTGLASAQAVAAARATYFGQQAEDAGKRVDSFIESLAKGGDVSKNQLQKALTEQFTAAENKRARSSQGRSAVVGGISAGIGVGAGAAAAFTGVLAPFAPIIATGVTTLVSPAVDYLVAEFGFFGGNVKKAAKDAEILANVLNSTATSSRDFEKFIQDIDNKNSADIANQSNKLVDAYIYQQQQLSRFQPEDLKTATDEVKERFGQLSEAVKNTENNILRAQGEQLKSAVKRSSQLTSQGFIPDADKLLEPVFASIQSTVRAKYAGEIEAARKVGNINRVQNLEATQTSEIIKQQEEARRTLNAATQQQLELIAAEKLELDIRNKLIGSLQKQLAISAASERMAYELNRVSDSISDIDARYSGNLTGMKSKYDTSVLGLKSPDEKRLSDALAPVKSLGPIGENLASNIIDVNKVLPNLEAKLIQFSTATDTASGALFDVEKFVEQSFGVKAGSVVGKALVGIIEDTTRGTGGERGVTAAKTSLREPEVRKKIVETFEKFGEEFKTSASDILNNMAAAEKGALETAQKLNESRQKQIELSMQGVDSLSRYAESVSKATGRDLSLYEKNYFRNLKQQMLAGNLANNSAGIGKRLSEINNDLKNPDLDPNKKAALTLEQSKLKSALEGLANQADRASDVLSQIEKIKAQRESIRDIGREFATGTPEEQNKLAQELQAAMTVAATGTFQSIPQELRKGADAIFERFKDIPGFKQAQNTAIADQFMRMGAPLAAQMVMTETTTPEQKLLGELKVIAFEELKAQLVQIEIEKQRQKELQSGIDEYTTQIGGYTKKLEALVQKFEEQAREKAIPVKGEAVPVIGDVMGAALQIPPSDAKAKIDLENIAAINQANKDIAETLKQSDTLIETFQKNITSLNEILNTLVTNEEAKKEKDNKKAAADAFEKEQQILQKVRENRGEVQPSRKIVGGGIQWNADGGLIYRADGGSIFKPRGTDTVPAMLTPGEYVIKKSSVDSIGTDTLDAINSGQYRANGGLIYRHQGGGSSFSAQSNSSIETRLAKLEKRVESLQQENQQLKNELSRLGAGDMQGMSQQMQQMNMSMQQMSDGMNMTAQQFMQPRQGRASRKQRLYEARANARAVSSDSNEPAQVIIPEPPKDRKPTRDKLDLIESFQASGASHLANLISNGTVSLPHAEDASNAMQNMSNAQNITSPDGVKQDLNSRIPRAESALNATLPKKDLSLKDLMSQPQQEEKPFNIGGIGPLPEKEVMEFMGPPTPLQFAKDEYNKRQWQREGAAKQVLAKAKPTMTPEQQQARIAELTAMNKQKNAELKKLPLSPEQERLKENERLRIEQLKDEISAGHQTQQKDGTWRQSTYEEVTRGMKQKPKGVSEEFWLKQILEGQKQGSLKFFQGVAKKGKMAENSDYGSAAQTRSLESQAVIDKAKELGKSADALTERRSGKAVGTNYKSLEDVPVLNAEQVGSPVTMKDIKNLQSQAASPVFSGKNLSPAENIANRTLPNMNPQYEGSDPLSQYLNAKGDIFAKEAVKNRIEDNQTWAGMGLAGSFKRDAGVEAQMQNQQMKDNQLPYTDFSFKNFVSKKKSPFPTGFANGGSTDTIPAMLTPGEYVMNSNAVSKHGKAFMDHLNRGGEVPGFNTGGFVSYLAGGGRSFRGGRTGGRSGVDRRELAKKNGVMSVAQVMQNQYANNPMVQQLGLNAPQVNAPRQQQETSVGAGAGPAAGAGITEAVQQFSQFVGQFQEAAKMMSGMTMTHKVTIDGQVNIGGIDGPGIAKAITDNVGTYIKEQVVKIMNENNSKGG